VRASSRGPGPLRPSVADEGDGSYTVTDKGSSNGTFVNSTRVTGSAQLVAGDTLVVGAQRFHVEVDA
jgi:pSer/pThr/pTyr-binding forkhead associated (FHA) protein